MADVISKQDLLDLWQKNRRITRKVLNAFPDDKLFTHTIGGMRPFGEMIVELLHMAVPIAQGVQDGTWTERKVDTPASKADLLRAWDEDTKNIDEIWAKITPDRWDTPGKAFGQYPGTGKTFVLYAIQNEIHHRGQGYVYLRSLGVEPPAFYDAD